jgi:hypothetical protein
VGALPEAAGIVFGGGFPRHATEAGAHAAQRAIFHMQRELERLVVGERQVAVALCDRGTLDGMAYWPDSALPFESDLGVTRAAELERYAAVIHLRTPEVDRGYNNDNPLRIESAESARALDERILAAWEGHPQRTVVESTDDFVEKAVYALELIQAQLPGCCQHHPMTTT